MRSSESGPVELEAGSDLFQPGDPSDAVFIVQQGELHLLGRDGEREVLLRSLRQGDFFGAGTALDGSLRKSRATARTACTILRIEVALLPAVLRERPEVAVRVIHSLASQLEEAHWRVTGLGGAVNAPVATETGGGVAVAGERVGASGKAGSGAAAGAAASAAVSESGEGPFLRHRDSGRRFAINPTGTTQVGRSDEDLDGIEIDLTPVDDIGSVSRVHATLAARDGRLYVFEDRPSTNGTFVDDTKLDPGVEIELSDGCEVRFGGVRMTLHV